jgi:hypothetical protein
MVDSQLRCHGAAHIVTASEGSHGEANKHGKCHLYIVLTSQQDCRNKCECLATICKMGYHFDLLQLISKLRVHSN